MMMEALRSYETSVLTRAIRRNIPEDDILQMIDCLQSGKRNIFVRNIDKNSNQTNSVALSPRANYTDWETVDKILVD
jgi:hypothetical protein